MNKAETNNHVLPNETEMPDQVDPKLNESVPERVTDKTEDKEGGDSQDKLKGEKLMETCKIVSDCSVERHGSHRRC